MQIILLTDVDNLGTAGELVVVKDGYARNMLIPSGLAAKADPKNIRMIEAQRKAAEARSLKELKTHQAMATRLTRTKVVAKVKVGEEDRMFGAVTSSDIAELLKAQDIEIDRRIIDLSEPIKSLGEHLVPVKLHAEVVAHLKVVVEQED